MIPTKASTILTVAFVCHQSIRTKTAAADHLIAASTAELDEIPCVTISPQPSRRTTRVATPVRLAIGRAKLRVCLRFPTFKDSSFGEFLKGVTEKHYTLPCAISQQTNQQSKPTLTSLSQFVAWTPSPCPPGIPGQVVQNDACLRLSDMTNCGKVLYGRIFSFKPTEQLLR